MLPVQFTDACNQHSKTTIQFQDSKVHCSGKQYTLPQYVDVKTYVDQLLQKKRMLTKEYALLTSKIIHDVPMNKERFDQLVKEIQEIDDRVYTVNQSAHIEQDALQETYNTYVDTMKHIVESQQVNRAKQLADIFTETPIKSIRYRHELFKRQSPFVNGVYQPATKSKDKNTAIHINIETTPVSIPKVPAPKPLSPQERTIVKNNIRDLVKSLFAFNDINECTSKARTKPYYASKDDILKVIEENDALRRSMPSNYKKLNKDQLCEFFYASPKPSPPKQSPKQSIPKLQPISPPKPMPPPITVPKPKPISPTQKNDIKENIKDILKQTFKFKNIQECTSKARTKDFYSSKEDILQAIEANDSLKKLMPANYKKLNKDQLCEFFYKE